MTAAAALVPVGRMLLGPWQQRWNRHERWSLWLPLVVVPVATLAGLWKGPAIATVVGAMLGAMVAIGAWAAVVANLLEQNQPTAARLVPGHPRLLRGAMAVAAVLALAAVAAAWLAMAEAVGHLSISVGDVPVPVRQGMDVALGVAALVVTATALLVRWPGLGWSVFAITALAASREAPVIAAAGRAAWQAWASSPGLLTAMALGLAVGVPVAMVQDGGARHGRSYARRHAARERFRRRSLGLEAAAVDQIGALDVVGRSRLGAYQRLFARALRHPRPGVGRLLLGLGPSGHWSTMAGKVAGMLLMAALVISVLTLFGPEGVPAATVNGMSFGLMFVAATPVMQMRARFHQAGGAQALLVLAPGVPRGPALARGLALRATGEFMVGWLVLYGLTRGVLALQEPLARAHLASPAGRITATTVDIVAIAVVPLVAMAWRRLDRLPAPRQSAVLGDLALMGLSTFTVAGLRWLHMPLPVVAATWAVATAAWCAWRWHRMGGEPAPLPAGRHRG